ncbi:hypothetical protein C0995_008411 [Termitomyces sp. Mi166|nr:hypothetical protein C0995_008411 [Termitomyces sp. Mi166\
MHSSHLYIIGLPNSQTEVDASKMAVVFYCIGSLDLLGLFHDKTNERDRASWREWIWQQQTSGRYGSGFRPSPFMTTAPNGALNEAYTDYDTPHLIMTYTALLSLAIFRDDFSRLDRKGLLAFIRACQRDDGRQAHFPLSPFPARVSVCVACGGGWGEWGGKEETPDSFSIVPGSNETDLRSLYCAFAISAMLDDWSAIDKERAIEYIASCRTYEGGYGQAPYCEAQGGTTYIAIASLHLVPSLSKSPLTLAERQLTIHWLISNSHPSGGFCGRTGKDADACYCFWCGAALHILGAGDLVDTHNLARFLASCQFKYGGISKAPGEHPALSMYSPASAMGDHVHAASWTFEPLDPLLNARAETARWARQYIPEPRT